MSNQGDQIHNPEDPTDRGLKRLHVAGGAARAALVQPWKRGRTGAAAPASRAKGCPLATFFLVPINTPLFFRKISRVYEKHK